MRIRQSKIWILFLVTVIAFGALTVLTPLTGDDLRYHCMFANYDIDTSRLVKSMKDVIASNIVHFKYVNGRALIHSQSIVHCGIYRIDLPIRNKKNHLPCPGIDHRFADLPHAHFLYGISVDVRCYQLPVELSLYYIISVAVEKHGGEEDKGLSLVETHTSHTVCFHRWRTA